MQTINSETQEYPLPIAIMRVFDGPFIDIIFDMHRNY